MTCLACYLLTFAACILGTICGMGCTVIAMSCWSVGKTALKKESALDLRSAPLLAVGAAPGGFAGKRFLTWWQTSLPTGTRGACRRTCCFSSLPTKKATQNSLLIMGISVYNMFHFFR